MAREIVKTVKEVLEDALTERRKQAANKRMEAVNYHAQGNAALDAAQAYEQAASDLVEAIQKLEE